MSTLYDKVGEVTYTNLLADPQGADVIAVPVEPGDAIPAGTVLYRKATGLYAPAASAQITATNALVVCKDEIEANATNIAEDAVAYRAGCFVDGAVKLAAGAALTDAHKAVLRGQNIVFDKKESTGTFKNNTEA